MASEVKYKFWINEDENFLIGEGRVRLLESIIVNGSISKAAKSLGISYKKAWRLVNSMNENSKKEIVFRSVGGIGGGGTSVTEKGKELIAHYNFIQRQANTFFKEFSKD